MINLVDFDIDTKGGESMKVGIKTAASDHITSRRMNCGTAMVGRLEGQP